MASYKLFNSKEGRKRGKRKQATRQIETVSKVVGLNLIT